MNAHLLLRSTGIASIGGHLQMLGEQWPEGTPKRNLVSFIKNVIYEYGPWYSGQVRGRNLVGRVRQRGTLSLPRPPRPPFGRLCCATLASRCPSLGPSRVMPGARAPLGHPRRCLPRGDPIFSRARAQLRARPKPPGGCLRRPAHSVAPFL